MRNAAYFPRAQRGQSIIEVLITMGIMGVVILGVVSMQTNQNRENRALTEKLAALDFQSLMIRTLSNGAVCAYKISTVASPTFDAALIKPDSSPPPIDLGSSLPSDASPSAPAIAQVGTTVSSISNSLQVKSIQIANIKCPAPCPDPTTSTHFVGDLQVSFNEGKLVRALRPATSKILIQASGPGSIKTISACQAGGGSTSATDCPEGSVVIGTSPDGKSVCSIPVTSDEIPPGTPCGFSTGGGAFGVSGIPRFSYGVTMYRQFTGGPADPKHPYKGKSASRLCCYQADEYVPQAEGGPIRRDALSCTPF